MKCPSSNNDDNDDYDDDDDSKSRTTTTWPYWNDCMKGENSTCIHDLFVCLITKSFLTYSFCHLHLFYQQYLGLCHAPCVQSHQRKPRLAVAIVTSKFQVSAADFQTVATVAIICNMICTHIYQGAVSIRKMVLPGMVIPMLKIRRPNGRLIFNMEIAIRR